MQLRYAALAVLIPVLIVPLTYYCWRRKKASKYQQEPEITNTGKEINLDHAGRLASRAEALQEEKGSEITYAAVRFCSAGTPWKPRTEKGLETVEQEKLLYSKVKPTQEEAV